MPKEISKKKKKIERKTKKNTKPTNYIAKFFIFPTKYYWSSLLIKSTKQYWFVWRRLLYKKHDFLLEFSCMAAQVAKYNAYYILV